MTTDEFARSLMKSGDVFTRADVYAFVEQTAKWQKQQWIEKACDVYCKDCEYVGCDQFECLALEKFKKAMEE